MSEQFLHSADVGAVFEQDRLGVPRQSLIKIWIAERLAISRHKVEQFGAGNA